MSLSVQLPLNRHIVVVGVLTVCLASSIGCGGGEEPTASDASAISSPVTPPQPPAVDLTVTTDTDRKDEVRADEKEKEKEKEPPETRQAASPVQPGQITVRFGHSDEDAPPLVVPAAASPIPEQMVPQVHRPERVEDWTDTDFLSAAVDHDPKLLDAIDLKVKSAPGDASVAVLLTRLLDPAAALAAMNSEKATPAPAASEPETNSNAVPRPTIAPQSSYRKNHDSKSEIENRTLPIAIDGAAAMILEAAVSSMPQGGAVGAVASRLKDEDTGKDRERRSKKDEKDEDIARGMHIPSGDQPGGGGQPVADQLQDRQVVERIVDSLIANNSQNAWQTIYGLVAGTVKSPLSAELNCEIVVERLIQNMNSNPDVIQPVMLTILDSAAPVAPENRKACLRMLSATSAAQIDKLTGFASAEQPPGAAEGTNSNPLNANGTGLLGGMGRKSRDDEDSGFTPQVPNGVGTGISAALLSSLPKISLTPEVVANGADFLWSPQATGAIVKQLENTTDLSTASDLIFFACTVPVAEVRRAICATFLRLHPNGSDTLTGSGLFGEVHDPALLVILKSLPRTRPPKETPGIMDSWTSGTESLVLALRNELRRTSASMKPYTDSLPVKLHKDATAEISVVRELSAESDATTNETVPAATQIFYTRTTFSPQRQRDIEDLTDHYEGRTSGFSRPDPAKGVMWIEGVKSLPNGHRRSMDVVIEKSDGGGGAGGTFSVEIIVVDILDPKAATPSDTTQASTEQ